MPIVSGDDGLVFVYTRCSRGYTWTHIMDFSGPSLTELMRKLMDENSARLKSIKNAEEGHETHTIDIDLPLLEDEGDAPLQLHTMPIVSGDPVFPPSDMYYWSITRDPEGNELRQIMIWPPAPRYERTAKTRRRERETHIICTNHGSAGLIEGDKGDKDGSTTRRGVLAILVLVVILMVATAWYYSRNRA